MKKKSIIQSLIKICIYAICKVVSDHKKDLNSKYLDLGRFSHVLVKSEGHLRLEDSNNYSTKLSQMMRSPSIFKHSVHSSEIRGLRSTKCSSEMHQNLLYFMYKKTHVVFFVFHFVQLYIFTL